MLYFYEKLVSYVLRKNLIPKEYLLDPAYAAYPYKLLHTIRN